MEDLEIKKYEEMARISKALSHPSRLFIIHKLGEQEYCVKDLSQMIGAHISTVSKHLTILKKAGIIDSEKRGNFNFYKLQTRCVLDIFNYIMNVINFNKDKKNKI